MTFVVKSGRKTDKHSLKDMLQEAALRTLRQRKKNGDKVSVVTEVSVGKAKAVFNTYFLLLEVGMELQAAKLKVDFLEKYGIDISKEPKVEYENTIRVCIK